MVRPLSIFLPIILICFVVAAFFTYVIQPSFEKNITVHAQALSGASEPAAPIAITNNAGAGAAILNDGRGNLMDGLVTSAAPAPLEASSEAAAYPGLVEFAASVLNGQAEDVVGVYIRDILALPVTQQPEGQTDFVAAEHNLLTQFATPKKYGAVGLLAHNYLSGSRFTQLIPDTEIILIFGGGRIERFRVQRVENYQALDPNSPFSDFIDLASIPAGSLAAGSTSPVLTSADLFRKLYTTSGTLILQTCIEAAGEPTWGRMFVIAAPLETLQLSVPRLTAGANLN